METALDSPRRTTPPGAGLRPSAQALVRTLAYFSLFGHPLRREELPRILQGHPATPEALARDLEDLEALGIAATTRGMVHLAGEDHLVDLRRDMEQRAMSAQGEIRRTARTVARFPFVRGLLLSGSLSKGVQPPGGDIDFLVLAAPGRVQVCNAFLALWVRFLPHAFRRRYCLNYFLDIDHLALPDRNLFVATEIAFLRPLAGGPAFRAFLRGNAWVGSFYPGWNPAEIPGPVAPSLPRRFLERWLSGPLGDRLEVWLHGLRRRRTARPEADPDAEFRLEVHELKFHSHGRQARIRGEFEARLSALERIHGLRIERRPWEGAGPASD